MAARAGAQPLSIRGILKFDGNEILFDGPGIQKDEGKRNDPQPAAECDVVSCGRIAAYDVPNQPRAIGLKFGRKV
ncbi:MAG TPA: hypothetical protein VN692_16950 [Steroidobacteraceae bacterium]|nr:hypothetical protein [Steroidobacteraceae bacterium]